METFFIEKCKDKSLKFACADTNLIPIDPPVTFFNFVYPFNKGWRIKLISVSLMNQTRMTLKQFKKTHKLNIRILYDNVSRKMLSKIQQVAAANRVSTHFHVNISGLFRASYLVFSVINLTLKYKNTNSSNVYTRLFLEGRCPFFTSNTNIWGLVSLIPVQYRKTVLN